MIPGISWHDIPSTTRRWIWIALALTGLFLAGSMFWYFFTHARITVSTTSDGAVLSILQGSSVTARSEKSKTTSAWVETGEYSVMINNRDNTNYKKMRVTVKPFQENSFTIEPSTSSTPEAVTNLTMQYPFFTDTSLSFYDYSRNQLATVNKDNVLHYNSTTLTDVRNIEWSNSGTGFILCFIDKLPIMYRFDGTNTIPIHLPKFLPTSAVSFTINESNRLYLLIDKDLYKSDDEGKSFQKTLSVNLSDPHIQAAQGEKLIMLSAGPKPANNQPNFSYTLTSMDTSGRVYGKLDGKNSAESPDTANDVQWSPDGKRIAFTDGFHAVVYSDSFSKLFSLPDGLVSGVTWESPTSLLYTGNNAVWRVDTDDQIAQAIASVYSVYKTYAVNPPTNNKTIYFLAGNDRFYSWYRITESSKPNETANKLGASDTRKFANGCTMHYLNINRLSILEGVDALQINNPSAHAICDKTVRSHLATMGVDASNITVQIQPSIESLVNYMD